MSAATTRSTFVTTPGSTLWSIPCALRLGGAYDEVVEKR